MYFLLTDNPDEPLLQTWLTLHFALKWQQIYEYKLGICCWIEGPY